MLDYSRVCLFSAMFIFGVVDGVSAGVSVGVDDGGGIIDTDVRSGSGTQVSVGRLPRTIAIGNTGRGQLNVDGGSGFRRLLRILGGMVIREELCRCLVLGVGGTIRVGCLWGGLVRGCLIFMMAVS